MKALDLKPEALPDLPSPDGKLHREILPDRNRAVENDSGDTCIHHLFEEQARLDQTGSGRHLRESSLVKLFEDQVGRTPYSVALSCKDREMVYSELNAQANRLALHLRQIGVREGGTVGISSDRSIEFVLGVLGILKAGGTYVPLPSEYPCERLSFMIGDTRMKVILSGHAAANTITHPGVKNVFLSEGEAWRQNGTPGNTPCQSHAGSAAYVMYTSGSTGQPKGVVIPHRAVSRLVLDQDYAAFGKSLRTLLLAPTAFDASTFELWAPLLHGGTCVIFPDRKLDLIQLENVIGEGGINCLWLTASLFNLVVDHRPAILNGLGHLLTGGEALSVPHVRKALAALPLTRLTNCYGPTESTTFATTYPIRPLEAFKEGSVPIGRPLSRTTCHLVDGSMNPVPVGSTGELLIGGDGLALGYLNQPVLTAEKFLPDPFSGEPGARLYRTGDLCRRLPDGNIEFLGRLDGQVKVRGFRVETGEIETALQSHPDVEQVAVSARKDEQGTLSLRACIVPKKGMCLDVPKLRSHLESLLPEPMVPAEWMALERLPLTPNGKLDRQALASLPPMELKIPEDEQNGVGQSEKRDARIPGSPANQLELQLIQIWEKLLGRKNIGRNDNFFELGGHSLKAARLVLELEKLFGHRVAIASLFQAPTVAALARMLMEEDWMPAWTSLVPLQPLGDKRPLFVVHGRGGEVFVFLDLSKRLAPDQPVYGLQAVGLDGRRQRHQQVEEMAGHYIREIRSLQHDGPYNLAGYSCGGWIAYEMAQQLRRQNQEVSLLALFDTRPNGRIPWWLFLVMFGPGLAGKFMRHCRNWVLLPVAEKKAYFSKRMKGLSFLSKMIDKKAPPSQTDCSSSDWWFYVPEVIARYTPQPYEGSVDFFRAKEMCPGLLWFWRRLVRKGLRVHELDCRHDDIFIEKNLERLKGILKSVLAASQNRNSMKK